MTSYDYSQTQSCSNTNDCNEYVILTHLVILMMIGL